MECILRTSGNEFVKTILETTEQLNSLKDVDTILDRILLEARRMCCADAGSIFLVEDNKLKFSYVHNDTLCGPDSTSTAVYSDFSVPIDEKSIVGYVAQTGTPLVIDDAYRLPPDRPYSFNRSFDETSGYRTTSILTIPLKTFQSKLVGVMQLINALDREGRSVPFSEDCRTYTPLFANSASVAIERGIMTRELILRMMKMAELRDPEETGPHVQRVGAYSAEIYHRWALNKGLDAKKIKQTKDMIRLAAMLHDVGKVGIPDAILKKPGKLTEEEYETMKLHTVFGARLFGNSTSELDRMSYEIALHHHEKWAGGGYPGKIGDELDNVRQCGQPHEYDEIPLSARITGLADVFDALCSRRSYKEAWGDDKVLSVIRQESGRHFDPDVVEAFLQIFDIIKAIRAKFKDTPESGGKDSAKTSDTPGV